MITIYHGEDIDKSRRQFISDRQKKQNVEIIDGTSITATQMLQSLQKSDLFHQTKYIFIEDFFSKRKSIKETHEIIAIIDAYPDSEISFWESTQLTNKQLSLLKNARTLLFKPSQILFQFLDALRPGNVLQIISLFHKLLADEEIQLVFAMLIRQIRILLIIQSADENTIDEVKRMAPWQKSKLIKQSSQFTHDQLISIYDFLYRLEYSQKTGTLTMPLSSSIDFLLSSL